MLTHQQLDSLLVFNIQTVPKQPTEPSEETPLGKNWQFKKIQQDQDLDWQQNAGLYPEFGKIVSMGIAKIEFVTENEVNSIKVSSSTSNDEQNIVSSFMHGIGHKVRAQVNGKPASEGGFLLAGHNIKGFHMPYMLKNCIKYNFQIPEDLNLYAQKPWETALIDTAEMWRMNAPSSASLHTISHFLGLSISDLDEDINKLYWQNGDLETIDQISKQNAKLTAQIILKMANYTLPEAG